MHFVVVVVFSYSIAVIHVEILSEAMNEFNHDANYRVRLIHTFKLTSGVTTVRSVWILGNQCHCPLLLPGKQYLLMGRLGTRAGSSEPIAEINRQSYVEVWKASIIRRLPALMKRCPLKTTQSSSLARQTTGLTTGILYISYVSFDLVSESFVFNLIISDILARSLGLNCSVAIVLRFVFDRNPIDVLQVCG